MAISLFTDIYAMFHHQSLIILWNRWDGEPLFGKSHIINTNPAWPYFRGSERDNRAIYTTIPLRHHLCNTFDRSHPATVGEKLNCSSTLVLIFALGQLSRNTSGSFKGAFRSPWSRIFSAQVFLIFNPGLIRPQQREMRPSVSLVWTSPLIWPKTTYTNLSINYSIYPFKYLKQLTSHWELMQKLEFKTVIGFC